MWTEKQREATELRHKTQTLQKAITSNTIPDKQRQDRQIDNRDKETRVV